MGQRAATLPPKRNTSPPSNMIIAFLGKTVNEYLKNYPIFLDKLQPICTICEGKCHYHCWYKRKIRREPNPVIIKILRVKCTHCGATHAVLPDFIHPKGRYSEQIREETITGHESGKTQEMVSGAQSVKTTGRWLKKHRETIKQIIAALNSILARLGKYKISGNKTPQKEFEQIITGIETILQPLRSSCRFGKVNILLTWQNIGIWI